MSRTPTSVDITNRWKKQYKKIKKAGLEDHFNDPSNWSQWETPGPFPTYHWQPPADEQNNHRSLAHLLPCGALRPWFLSDEHGPEYAAACATVRDAKDKVKAANRRHDKEMKRQEEVKIASQLKVKEKEEAQRHMGPTPKKSKKQKEKESRKKFHDEEEVWKEKDEACINLNQVVQEIVATPADEQQKKRKKKHTKSQTKK